MDLVKILIFMVIAAVSGIASLQDIKWQKVHNLVIFSGIFAVFLINLVLNRGFLIESLLSAFIYFMFYFVVKLMSKGKFGNADLYFGIFQGLCLPIKMLPLCVLLETLLAYFFILIFKKRMKDNPLPFIPFMATSLIICNFLQLVI